MKVSKKQLQEMIQEAWKSPTEYETEQNVRKEKLLKAALAYLGSAEKLLEFIVADNSLPWLQSTLEHIRWKKNRK